MATTFRTSAGDVLDTLCYRYYGHLKGTVEAVLGANPGLADEEQPYQGGLLIAFPDLAAPTDDNSIQLWD